MAEKKDWKAEEAKAKENWLKEHLPYELKMMRHCLRRLTQQESLFFLDWNAQLSGFAVAAGNLTAFLTNAERKHGNFQACEFVEGGFVATKDAKLVPIFNKMEPYLFHLGKYRPTDEQRADKFGVEDAKKIAEWVERWMKEFVSKLSKQQKLLWDEKGSFPPEPPSGPTLKFVAGLPNQTSSSYATSISSQGYTGYRDEGAGKS